MRTRPSISIRKKIIEHLHKLCHTATYESGHYFLKRPEESSSTDPSAQAVLFRLNNCQSIS